MAEAVLGSEGGEISGGGEAGLTCLHAAFARRAAREPGRVAVRSGARALTYDELERDANGLAAHLKGLGVGPEALVGIALPRGLEMVTTVLATLEAGGAYVPLDPSYPQARLAQVIEDARPAVVVTTSAVRAALTLGTAKAVCLDTDADTIAGPSASAGDVDGGARPDSLAYVIYTSGSTGTPKGVMIEHRMVGNFFAGMDRLLGASPDAGGTPGVWLAGTSLSFDISVLELLWTLTRGFTVIVQPEEDKVRSFSESVAAHGVTHFQCTPSMAGLLVADAEARAALGALQVMLVGGEALPPSLAHELLGALRGRLFNVYGPTETTIWSTAWPVDGDALARGEPVSIGSPLLNTTLHVLDEHGALVDAGAEGELHIGGAGVSRGYLRRPELTAERFLPNPFGGGSLYKTGDLVRARGEGQLEFLGRLDHQVKIRGHRVELGEIEHAVRECAGVREVVVIAHDGAPGAPEARRLVAYIGGAAPTAPDLRRLLRDRLPEPMVPSAFVVLDKLPLTPNGKIDRKALPPPEAAPAPGADDDGAESGYVAPSTPTEKIVAAIWCEVLGLPRVSLYDTFFDLGGHSLLSPRVMQLIELRLEKSLNVSELFLQNLAQVAARCDRAPSMRPKAGGVLGALRRVIGRG
jgi:amino acid adenylation domain-containing protein